MKIWCQNYNNATYTDAAMQDVTRFRGMRFFNGNRLRDSFPTDATVQVRTKRKPTDYFEAGMFSIISEKLRLILERFDVEAEYFPVRLVHRRGNSLDGSWWCFNPLLVRDWFDWSKSQYVDEQNFATEIRVLVATENVLTGLPLAVSARTIPRLVAVSDALVEEIIDQGCTGVVFREPHEWTDPVNPVQS